MWQWNILILVFVLNLDLTITKYGNYFTIVNVFVLRVKFCHNNVNIKNFTVLVGESCKNRNNLGTCQLIEDCPTAQNRYTYIFFSNFICISIL